MKNPGISSFAVGVAFLILFFRLSIPEKPPQGMIPTPLGFKNVGGGRWGPAALSLVPVEPCLFLIDIFLPLANH